MQRVKQKKFFTQTKHDAGSLGEYLKERGAKFRSRLQPVCGAAPVIKAQRAAASLLFLILFALFLKMFHFHAALKKKKVHFSVACRYPAKGLCGFGEVKDMEVETGRRAAAGLSK